MGHQISKISSVTVSYKQKLTLLFDLPWRNSHTFIDCLLLNTLFTAIFDLLLTLYICAL